MHSFMHSDTLIFSVPMKGDRILMVVLLSLLYTNILFISRRESESVHSFSHQGAGCSSVSFPEFCVLHSAEIFTTSVLGFRKGGASGVGGGGASGLALELFEGGVGILMIAVVTTPLLLQFRLPDSSDIRFKLERLRQSARGLCENGIKGG